MKKEKPTKKDKVVSDLIKVIGKEIDYWLMAENTVELKLEYGPEVYKKITDRMRTLRNKLFTSIIPLIDETKS